MKAARPRHRRTTCTSCRRCVGMIAALRGQEAFTNNQAARAIACCEEALGASA